MKHVKPLVATFLLLFPAASAFSDSSAGKHLNHAEDWYKTDEAKHIADAVLSFQSPRGDWPKNIDTAKAPYTGRPEDLKGTFDNGATTTELRCLARMAASTADPRYANAFLKGLDHILAAQYDNGGWPQSHPPGNGYARHITFNDGAMTRLMFFLREVANDDKAYRFVDPEHRKNCTAAWDKGVRCILDCQIKVNGHPTVWCAQHDAVTLAPAQARSYELPSFSGGESAGIAMLLMELENPSDSVKQAVRGAALWYQRHKLTGIKLERLPDRNAPKGFDLAVVHGPDAPPLWARFYDLETGKPFFCGRDGVKKSSLAQIDPERRTGYTWLGSWGQRLLDAYPKWAARHGLPTDLTSRPAVPSDAL